MTQYLTLNDLSYLQHKNKQITPAKSHVNIELQRETVEGMTEYDSEYDYGADITFYRNKENGPGEPRPHDKAMETEYKPKNLESNRVLTNLQKDRILKRNQFRNT